MYILSMKPVADKLRMLRFLEREREQKNGMQCEDLRSKENYVLCAPRPAKLPSERGI